MDFLLTGCFLLGLALLAYGAWLAYHPAGYMVAGFALLALPLRYVRSEE